MAKVLSHDPHDRNLKVKGDVGEANQQYPLLLKIMVVLADCFLH
jgi:hypothetical protein